MKPPTEILTKRLRLTTLSLDDLDVLTRLYSDPQVMAGSSGVAAARTSEESRTWLERTLAATRVSAGRQTFRVDDRGTGGFLGRCGLRTDARTAEAELAYAFVINAWGHGLATEAAKAILDWGRTAGVTTVTARAFAANIASQRVLEKAGLIRVGAISDPAGTLFEYAITLGDRTQR